MYSEFSKNQTNIQILMKVFTALPYIDIFTR